MRSRRPPTVPPLLSETGRVDLTRITPRRAQVLNLIAAHHTNPEIAVACGLARRTVDRTIEDLRGLTGCDSKGALARWWQEHAAQWDQQVRPLYMHL